MRHLPRFCQELKVFFMAVRLLCHCKNEWSFWGLYQSQLEKPQEEEATEATVPHVEAPKRSLKKECVPHFVGLHELGIQEIKVESREEEETKATKPPVEPPKTIPQEGMCPFLERVACICTSNGGWCGPEQQNFVGCRWKWKQGEHHWKRSKSNLTALCLS